MSSVSSPITGFHVMPEDCQNKTVYELCDKAERLAHLSDNNSTDEAIAAIQRTILSCAIDKRDLKQYCSDQGYEHAYQLLIG